MIFHNPDFENHLFLNQFFALIIFDKISNKND
jgi:hypothetical protein